MNSRNTTHPSQQFAAPSGIRKGEPLRNLLSDELIRLISLSIRSVYPRFDSEAFVTDSLSGLDQLELSQRAQQIGDAMAKRLPKPFSKASQLLIASLGPELTETEGNGLAPFFYLPHASMISNHGVDDFESGMKANHELTRRFTAEFSVRPFLVQHTERCLALLQEWTQDPNTHVRRLVSEGTRPRLPWAMRLRNFQQNPNLALPLLERLKDDPELYVRRSVANHVGDILKDHPDVGFSTCERWLHEVSGKKTPSAEARARKWIIRHAVRHPAKQGNETALKLRMAAK